MKYFLGLILILFFAAPNKTSKQLFDDFHTIYANADFNSMDTLLANDFYAFNEQGKISFDRSKYISYMQTWNQVFNTKWNVETVEVTDDEAMSLEYDTDMFNDYFYGGKHEVEYIYKFKNNTIQSITMIVTKEGLNAEKVFDMRFNNFCLWVKSNYPDKLKYCNTYDQQSAVEVKSLLKEYLKISK